MKKEIRQFTKYATRLIACALLICIVSAAEIPAQKKPKTTTTPKIYWYVDFTVTVKGNGAKTNEDGDSTINWTINRTYYGTQKLNLSQTTAKPEMIRWSTLPSKFFPEMRVTIEDILAISNKDEGEGSSFENSVESKSWKTDRTFSFLGIDLTTNNKLLTYNLNIPVVFLSGKEGVTMRSQTIYDRSDAGYGEAPTHEETPVKETQVSIGDFKLPDIKGLIQYSQIKHKTDRPLPANFSTVWEYDSGDLSPSKPLIDGVPDSKTNVKVRVRYRFSKTPIY